MKKKVIFVSCILWGVVSAFAAATPLEYGKVTEARWVYAAPTGDDFSTSICARLEFEIDKTKKVAKAWFYSCREKCDNLYVNGEGFGCTLWPDFKSLTGHVIASGGEITHFVKPGKNVIAMKLRWRKNRNRADKNRCCGFILRGAVEYADGTKAEFVSKAERVKVSEVEENGWQRREFDDSVWQRGYEIGDATSYPWARYSDLVRQFGTPEECAAYQEWLKKGGGGFPEEKLLAEPDSPNAKVVFSGRTPGIETNGRIIPPYSLMEVRLVPGETTDEMVRHASERGLRLYGLDRFLRGKYEAADGSYDFTQFDGGVRRILALDPEARFLLYYRNGAEMPSGWVEKHPDELVGFAKVTPGRKGFGDFKASPAVPSFASKVYREEERRFWKAFGDYARSQPWGRRIIGIHCGYGGSGDGMPCGCHAMPDTGKRMTEAFRRYLEKKYKTDAELQESWGDQKVTRRTAMVPDCAQRMATGNVIRDLADPRDRRLEDYYDCYTLEFQDFMIDFGKAVKEALPGCLAGAYFGYAILSYSPEGMTTRIDKLLESEYFDYFYSTTKGYNLLDGMRRILVDRCRKHGKLCSIEGDVRPHTAIGFGGEKEIVCTTPQDSRATFGKMVGNGLIWGTGWQAVDFGPAQSGVGKYWFDCDEALDSFEIANKLWKRLWEHPSDTPNEIAVVMDPDGPWRDGVGDRDVCEIREQKMVENPISALNLSGYAWNLVSLEEYASSEHRYRVVVFMNTMAMTKELGKAAAKAKKDGTYEVWCNQAGLRGEKGYIKDALERLTAGAKEFKRFEFPPVEPALWAKIFAAAGCKALTKPGFYVARNGDLIEIFSTGKKFEHSGWGMNCAKRFLDLSGDLEIELGADIDQAVDLYTRERYEVKEGVLSLHTEYPRTWLLKVRRKEN